MKLRKGICAVVFRKRGKKTEFLLLHRVLHWKGWEFPKGGLRKNETSLIGLFRELKEELGVSQEKIISVKSLDVFSEFDDFVRKMRQKDKAFLVQVSPKSKVVISKNPDSEHSSFRWLSAKKALVLLEWKDQKDIFKKALKISKK